MTPLRTTRPRRLRTLAASGIAALALGVSALAVPGALTSAQGTVGTADVFHPQLLKVDTPTRAAKTRLSKLGLDLTEHAGHDYVEVVVHSPLDLVALTAGGFTYDVEIEDMLLREAQNNRANAEYAAEMAELGLRSALPSGRTSYRTLADYNADMDELAKKRTLVKKFAMPRPSLDGRTIYGVEIGSDVRRPSTGRPTMVLMGAHHAREWPSAELAMEFATDLVQSYGKNRRITRLLDRARVVVVPVVNVDGFELSRTDGAAVDLREVDNGGTVTILGTPGQAYKRKNCRIVDGQDTPDGSCRLTLNSNGGFGLGTDLNRNYGGFWGGPGAAGTLPDPSSDRVAGLPDPTYRGAAPFSEPETQNVRDLIAGRQVTMMISNHTFSNLVLRPNGVNPTTIAPDGIPVGNAPDEEGLKRLGKRMTDQNGYRNIHGWELYDTTGTTEDWSYNATGGYGYTFEIGPDEFHPPFEQVVGFYRGTGKYAGKGNREAYLIALEHTVDTRFHGTLRAKQKLPKGTVLTLSKKFRTPTWEDSFADGVSSSITVPRSGRFSWVVNPSTRPVVRPRTFQAYDDAPYKSQTFVGGPTTPVVGTADHEFTVPATADLLKVDLTWATPDDLDLEIYRKTASGELEEVGGSGNAPATVESAQIVDAAPGTYVLRVVNYASVTPTYDLTAALFDSVTKRTKGKVERYTLTCSRGGKVLGRTSVLIDRGQTKALNLATCRR
ncbi:M14 family zinc carboxypeptidase [Nocardioides perillae]|uniref:Peptidase M14 domain-containing protein n=1 Tax=Nocardioides perillae TaxID=1119534 RepID=A0A7Y9RQ98_9ACTN|nr:M14 family zinc carboxypeptidase [Nocardioides perillae]NYG54546.1 hypothetical protein [Nocardioides perillae]